MNDLYISFGADGFTSADLHQSPQEGDRGRFDGKDVIEISIDESDACLSALVRIGFDSLLVAIKVKNEVVIHICLSRQLGQTRVVVS
jgi:hypothetical protein